MKKDFDDFDMTLITKILMHIQSYLYDADAITNTILKYIYQLRKINFFLFEKQEHSTITTKNKEQKICTFHKKKKNV